MAERPAGENPADRPLPSRRQAVVGLATEAAAGLGLSGCGGESVTLGTTRCV